MKLKRQIASENEIEDFDVTPAQAVAMQIQDKTAADVRRNRESEPPSRQAISALEHELEKELGELPKCSKAALALQKRLEQVIPKSRAEAIKLRHALKLVSAHRQCPSAGGQAQTHPRRKNGRLVTRLDG